MSCYIRDSSKWFPLHLDFLGSALTDIPIEDRFSQSKVQARYPAAPENKPGTSISALSVSSVAFQLHEAILTMNIKPIASQEKEEPKKNDILTSSPYKKELMQKAKHTKAMVMIKRNMKIQVKAKKLASEPYSQHHETECIICGEKMRIGSNSKYGKTGLTKNA
ncbi:unnamed protein product [Euphydryas editha]|uniref:Uncharacterized protein n=1 Tax=Euphydryas editha TaxID=104508 RepID=A0AAU9U4A6_EUPED|nr:unnamed protein product [Euphydryas editha]